jgi:hypothetical protein
MRPDIRRGFVQLLALAHGGPLTALPEAAMIVCFQAHACKRLTSSFGEVK